MADLRNNLGNRDTTKDALIDIVMTALVWAHQNTEVWETDFCCERMDCHLGQFQKYLMDLQDGLEPGTTAKRLNIVTSYLRNRPKVASDA